MKENSENMKRFVKDLQSAIDKNIIYNSSFWAIILEELQAGRATAITYIENGVNMVEIVDSTGTTQYIVPELDW